MPEHKLPRAPRKGDFFDVHVEDIDVRSGRVLGTIDTLIGPQEEPRVYDVLIRKAVPGDTVRTRVEGTKKRRLEAAPVEILTPSPARVEPRCPHFGLREESGRGCGGCTLQAMDYGQQLAAKGRMIRGIMKKGGVDPALVAEPIGMEDPWYYRNKMEFSFGDDRDRNFTVGLHPTGYKHDVLDLTTCYLQSPESAALLREVSSWCSKEGLKPYHFRRDEGWLRTITIREGKRTGERMVELTTSSGAELEDGRITADIAQRFGEFLQKSDIEVSGAYWTQHHTRRGERTRFIHEHLWGRETLREELHLTPTVQLSFEVHPRAFFQPNTFGAEILYRKVVEKAELDGATLLDLYCGTGTIGIALASFAQRVVGVEIVESAVENAVQNARHNQIANIEFICGDVGAVLEEQQLEADVAILDPPRAGLLPNAHEHIDATKAQRLVYVSCNPRALARDLSQLHQRGWTTQGIEPVDMFPHTHHVENVAVLTR